MIEIVLGEATPGVPVLSYKLAVFGVLPAKTEALARERIIRAVEAAVGALEGEGIYLNQMYFKTEEGGRVHGDATTG